MKVFLRQLDKNGRAAFSDHIEIDGAVIPELAMTIGKSIRSTTRVAFREAMGESALNLASSLRHHMPDGSARDCAIHFAGLVWLLESTFNGCRPSTFIAANIELTITDGGVALYRLIVHRPTKQMKLI